MPAHRLRSRLAGAALAFALVAAGASHAAMLDTAGATLAPVITTAGPPADYVVSSPGPLDGVARLTISRPDGLFGCSGALIGGGGFVLTAAHCLTNASGQVTATAVTATFAAAAGAPTRAGVQSHVAPGWTGDFMDGADIAIIALASPVLTATSYDIVSDEALGAGSTVVVAGYGLSGEGLMPSPALPFGTLRAGENRYDTLWDPADVGGAPFAFDFDDGTPDRDTIGNFIPALADLGRGALEVMIANGDSGGPSFLDGAVIGVHSFGGTYGPPFDLNRLLDSSFGEVGGDTRVALYAGWIDSVVNPIPEPGTWATMLAGLLCLAGAVRRSRRLGRAPGQRVGRPRPAIGHS